MIIVSTIKRKRIKNEFKIDLKNNYCDDYDDKDRNPSSTQVQGNCHSDAPINYIQNN